MSSCLIWQTGSDKSPAEDKRKLDQPTPNNSHSVNGEPVQSSHVSRISRQNPLSSSVKAPSKSRVEDLRACPKNLSSASSNSFLTNAIAAKPTENSDSAESFDRLLKNSTITGSELSQLSKLAKNSSSSFKKKERQVPNKSIKSITNGILNNSLSASASSLNRISSRMGSQSSISKGHFC